MVAMVAMVAVAAVAVAVGVGSFAVSAARDFGTVMSAIEVE